MFQKSKASSFASALRFAPIAASLTALVLVAACARTKGAAKISEESPDQILQSKVMTGLNAANKANYNVYDPANLALAARFQGATLKSANRAKGQLDAQVSIAIQNSADILASGNIKSDVDTVLADANAVSVAPNFKVSAKCSDVTCENVVVTLAELTTAPLTAPAPQGKTEDVQIEAGSEVVTKADPQAANQKQDVKPTVAAPTTTAVPTGAELVLMFKLTEAAKPEVTATKDNDASPATEDKFVLEWSTPTADQNLASGSVLSFEDAKAKFSTGAPVAPQVTTPAAPVAPVKPAAQAPATEVPASNGTATAPVPKAQAPAAQEPAAIAKPIEKKIEFRPVVDKKAVAKAVAASQSLTKTVTTGPAPKTVQLAEVTPSTPVASKPVAKATAKTKAEANKSSSKPASKSKSLSKSLSKSAKTSAAAKQLPSITAIAKKK